MDRMQRNLIVLACLALALALAACGKKPGQSADATAAPATPSQEAPSTDESPAMDATGAPAAATQEAAQAAPVVEDESAIVNDPKAQWAVRAQASSTYRGPSPKEPYSAWQATGAPNVPRYSDHALAWASKASDGGPEWLEVEFDRPVHARSVRVRQSHAPGAIVKLELIDASGGRHVAWEGIDETRGARDRIVWFEKEFERTPYRVKAVKLSLASHEVWGWNEIDAVQLVNADAVDANAEVGEPASVADGDPVRVESAYLKSGWLEGRIGPSPSGCRMVFLDNPTDAGYTSVALTTLERMERNDGAGWRDVAVKPLLAGEPSHCLEAAAD